VRGWETPILLGPLDRAKLHKLSPPPHLKTQAGRPRNVLSFRIPDDGENPKTLQLRVLEPFTIYLNTAASKASLKTSEHCGQNLLRMKVAKYHLYWSTN
jgi:hypothetical protein